MNISLYCYQEAAHRHLRAELLKGGAQLWRELFQMVVDILYCAIFAHKLFSAHLSYSLGARNIVRRVSPQGKYLPHLLGRRDAVLTANCIGTKNLHLLTPFGRFVLKNILCHYLAVVFVGSNHINLSAGGVRPLCGHRAYHIVCLVGGHHYYRYSKGLQYCLQRLQSCYYLLRRGCSVCFVERIGLVSEGLYRRVECNSKVGWAFPLD